MCYRGNVFVDIVPRLEFAEVDSKEFLKSLDGLNIVLEVSDHNRCGIIVDYQSNCSEYSTVVILSFILANYTVPDYN